MKCEIINPSDCCYLSGDDQEALSLACVVLGGGRYALNEVGTGKQITPIFMFGGFEEWWKKTFGHEPPEMTAETKLKIADVLDTLEYAGERSSMNNIGARAKEYAEQFREADAAHKTK